MPILKKGADSDAVLRAAGDMEAALRAAGIRTKVDAGGEKTPGWKFNYWEMKGVPVRVEASEKVLGVWGGGGRQRRRAGQGGEHLGRRARGGTRSVRRLLEPNSRPSPVPHAQNLSPLAHPHPYAPPQPPPPSPLTKNTPAPAHPPTPLPQVGPRDVEAGTCVTARRDVAGKEGKQMGVPLAAEPFVAHIAGLLEEVQGALLQQAREFRDANIVDVASYDELKAAVAEGERRVWVGLAGVGPGQARRGAEGPAVLVGKRVGGLVASDLEAEPRAVWGCARAPQRSAAG